MHILLGETKPRTTAERPNRIRIQRRNVSERIHLHHTQPKGPTERVVEYILHRTTMGDDSLHWVVFSFLELCW